MKVFKSRVVEGPAMAPQHLQQRPLRALLCDRLDAMHPFNWGGEGRAGQEPRPPGRCSSVFRGVLPDGDGAGVRQQHPEELPPIRDRRALPHTQPTLDIYRLPIERRGATTPSARWRYGRIAAARLRLDGGGTSSGGLPHAPARCYSGRKPRWRGDHEGRRDRPRRHQ
jgi:hypothetical protein